MIDKNKEKTSVQLSLKVDPLNAFLFRKYAEHYSLSLKWTFSDAMKCLIQTGIKKTTKNKWIKQYRKEKNEMA